jgi:hypothetical protein
LKNKELSDVAAILCDNLKCREIGEYPRCYLDIYKYCRQYEKKEKKKN